MIDNIIKIVTGFFIKLFTSKLRGSNYPLIKNFIYYFAFACAFSIVSWNSPIPTVTDAVKSADVA